MPALESGDLKTALKKMRGNVISLYKYVKKGYKIVAINPTCSLTLKEDYSKFLPPEERKEAEEISKVTKDINEYLFELKSKNEFNLDFKSIPNTVAYHVPCHLRAQNIGFRSRDMMKLIPQTTIKPVAECCGHDGTWSMREEFFEMSLKTGGKGF